MNFLSKIAKAVKRVGKALRFRKDQIATPDLVPSQLDIFPIEERDGEGRSRPYGNAIVIETSEPLWIGSVYTSSNRVPLRSTGRCKTSKHPYHFNWIALYSCMQTILMLHIRNELEIWSTDKGFLENIKEGLELIKTPEAYVEELRPAAKLAVLLWLRGHIETGWKLRGVYDPGISR